MPLCYDDFGNQVNCTNIEMGEQWYDAMAQWQAGGGSSDVSGFFSTHLSPYLSEIDISPTQFIDAYGSYFTNVVPDWATYDRFGRIKDITNRQFLADYTDKIDAMYESVGRSGFAGGGRSLLEQEDFWREYSDKANRAAIEQIQGEESIYEHWGSDWFNTLQTLTEEAFVEASGYESEEEYGEGEYYDTFQECLSQCGGYSEICLENCLGIESMPDV